MPHPATHPALPLALLVLIGALLQGGCAGVGGAVSISHRSAPLPAAPRGVIGVTSPSAPAPFSFERASGRRSAADGAVNGLSFMARAGAGSGEGAIAVVALLPVAAVVGAVANVVTEVPVAERTRGEAELQSALAEMAVQARFRDEFTDVARQRDSARFVAFDRMTAADSLSCPNLGSILEVSVVELRLERAALTDHSYTILIRARVRWLEPDGTGVLHDEPFGYRSGTAYFESWTHRHSLQEATRYGYRMLAEAIADRIMPAVTELLSAGRATRPKVVQAAPVSGGTFFSPP